MDQNFIYEQSISSFASLPNTDRRSCYNLEDFGTERGPESDSSFSASAIKSGYEYRELWRVIPLDGKEPCVKVSEIRSCGSEEYLGRIQEFSSYLNWGALCGKINNIFVLDIDVADDGVNVWRELCSKNAPINTRVVKTPTGGSHYYFEYEGWMDSLKGCAAKCVINGRKVGIDVRGDGGYIVLDKSIYPGDPRGHVDYKEAAKGKPYELISVSIRKCPMWVREFLLEHFSKREVPKETKVDKEAKKYPVPSIEQVTKCIEVVGPVLSGDRDSWRNIGFALKACGLPDDDALDLFHEFSKYCKSKYNRRACDEQWRTFRGEVEGGITFGYLRNEVKRISPGVYREIFPKALVRAKFGSKTFADFKRKWSNFPAIHLCDIPKIINELSACFAIINRDVPEAVTVNVEAGEACLSIVKLSVFLANDITFFENLDYVPDAERRAGRPKKDENKIRLGDLIKGYQKHLSYDEMVYSIEEVPDNILNTFLGFTAKIVPMCDDGAIALSTILSHIKDKLCDGNEECYEYTLNCMAFMLKTNRKLGKLLIYSGPQGVGKTTIWSWFSKYILGSRNSIEKSTMADVLERFNGNLANKRLILIHELERGFKDFSRFNSLATDATFTAEWKGIQGRQITSMHCMVATTNEREFNFITEGTRRPVLISCSNEVAGTEYFAALHRAIREHGNVFYTYLMDRDISLFNPNNVPIVALHAEVIEINKEENKNPVVAFLEDCYSGAEPGLKLDPKVAYAEFLEWCSKNGYSNQGRGAVEIPKSVMFVRRSDKRLETCTSSGKRWWRFVTDSE